LAKPLDIPSLLAAGLSEWPLFSLFLSSDMDHT